MMTVPRRSFVRSAGWVGFVGAVVLVCLAATALSVRAVEQERQVVYAVVPHADDEFQVWSFVEDSTNVFPVFLVMTQGDQTGYCTPDGYAKGWQPAAEPAAAVEPTGKWTSACSRSRAASLVDYLAAMSRRDPSVPGDFGAPRVVGPFDDPKGVVCRVDAADGPCTSRNTSAQVWTDRLDRGVVVLFDLGDGDLEPDEIQWAVQQVRDHRTDFGIDPSLSESGAVGAFANHSGSCFEYPHHDHVAVHDALRSSDLGLEYRAAATCADDADIGRRVSDRSVDAAFRVDEDGTRAGAHTSAYGWLWDPYYPIDREEQSELFTQNQYFWLRYRE
jgi:hypothetical protein